VTPNAVRTSATPRSDVEYISLRIGVLGRGGRRFEGEAYLTGGYAIRLQIESGGAPFAEVRALGNVWQPGRLKGIRVDAQHGTPFLTATQMFDIRPAPRKWLAPSKTADLARRYVERDWILVTCSGNVGDSIIGYAPHLGVIVSHDLLRILVEDTTQRGYLYGYLRSRFGRAMLQSSQYGSIIKHLEPEHVQDIPVVLAPRPLRDDVNERIKEVFRLRDEAFTLTRDAEARFETALGVSVAAEADASAYSISSDEIFGRRRRLDAYHYNPVAEAILRSLHEASRPIETLRSLADAIILPQRFKRLASPEHGVPYLDSEDIFKISPEITKFIPAAAMKNARDYFVQRGWILVARSGQIYGLNGSSMLATSWHENKIVSEHVIRVIPSRTNIRPGYLVMALGHPVFGRPLVLRLAFGTEVPEIDPDDLADFPVVRLGSATEDAIADMMERASELRLRANEAEVQAVNLVEQHVKAALGASAAHIKLLRTPTLAENELN
jgi:hypothetical protein